MSRAVSSVFLIAALLSPLTAMARGGGGGGGHGGGGGRGGGGGGFHGGGGGGFHGGGFSGGSMSGARGFSGSAYRGFSGGSVRSPGFSGMSGASRGSSGNFARPGISTGALNGRNGATANLANRQNLGSLGANRTPIANGVQAPWANGAGVGNVGNRAGINNSFNNLNRVGVNNVNFNSNHWNNWLGAGRYGYGASRYGWAYRNNSWVNNNYWYSRYGYRWNRGYWPWWYRFGYYPGWGAYGGYGYGGYGYGGYGYANPYYTASQYGPVCYDYSQPLPAAPTDADAPSQSTTQAAMGQFDDARTAFKQGDADAALNAVNAAIRLAPSDSQMHEFRSLVLFHQGNYSEAAATLYPVLAAGPGFNWDTVWSLYPSYDAYERDLRSLESYVKTHETEAPPRFLLAYQHLVAGHYASAQRDLGEVVRLQPEDKLSQSLLEALNKQDGSQSAAVPKPPAPAMQ
ncbi:MAG TPA: tetratricopeptide repeat protein [Planctomycetaceae bacterium]|nr:tetratricopeptide repeat protein [Planctomycetaceae bacterium]